jgi:hypothetical protein
MVVVGVMCLVEREEAGGRAAVEKAAGHAPFVAIYKASEIRAEHMKHADSHPTFAVSAKCDMCDQPAVTNIPANRCEAHKASS